MPITTYTTYDDVRAALGVSEDDIADATLALSLYSDNLQVEFEDVDLDIPSTFVTVSALPTRTEAQDRFLQAARIFATYAVAKHLADSLPMFGPESISDGKAAVKRFANPYKEVIDAVSRQFSRFRARLDTAFSAVSSSTVGATTTKVYFAVSSPAVDPVKGA